MRFRFALAMWRCFEHVLSVLSSRRYQNKFDRYPIIEWKPSVMILCKKKSICKTSNTFNWGRLTKRWAGQNNYDADSRSHLNQLHASIYNDKGSNIEQANKSGSFSPKRKRKTKLELDTTIAWKTLSINLMTHRTCGDGGWYISHAIEEPLLIARPNMATRAKEICLDTSAPANCVHLVHVTLFWTAHQPLCVVMVVRVLDVGVVADTYAGCGWR